MSACHVSLTYDNWVARLPLRHGLHGHGGVLLNLEGRRRWLLHRSTAHVRRHILGTWQTQASNCVRPSHATHTRTHALTPDNTHSHYKLTTTVGPKRPTPTSPLANSTPTNVKYIQQSPHRPQTIHRRGPSSQEFKWLHFEEPRCMCSLHVSQTTQCSCANTHRLRQNKSCFVQNTNSTEYHN